MRNILCGMILSVAMISPLWAQNNVPVGGAPTTQQAPVFSPDATVQNVEPPQSPELEAETQRMRQEWREQDQADTGLKWIPWAKAGAKVHEFIAERNPSLVKALGPNPYLDIAVADIDRDALPDIITYDWNECTRNGCGIKIYFSNKSRKPALFYATKIKPYDKGVMIDDSGYFAY